MSNICKVIRLEHVLYGCGPYRIRSQVLYNYLDRSNPSYLKMSDAELKIINDNITAVNRIISDFVDIAQTTRDGVYGYTKHPTPSISFGKHIDDILWDKFDGLEDDKSFNPNIVFGFQNIESFGGWFFDTNTIEKLCIQGFEIVEYSVPDDAVVKDTHGDQLIFDKRKVIEKAILKSYHR